MGASLLFDLAVAVANTLIGPPFGACVAGVLVEVR